MEVKGFKSINPSSPDPFNVSPTDFESLDNSLWQNGLKEMCKKIIDQREQIIFDFLKARGYRPKFTKKYAKNLQYRLHRKGLELASETTQHPFDEKNLTYSETYRVFFKPYTNRNNRTEK